MAFAAKPKKVSDRTRFRTLVEDLFTYNADDGEIVRTKGYHTVGKGGAAYYYDATSTATVDGVFTLPGVGGSLGFSKTNVYDQTVNFTGEAGTGRYIAVDQSAVRTYQAGCYGDDSTEDSVPLQMAVNVAATAGVAVLLEPGTYILGNQTEGASLGTHGAAARLILPSGTKLIGSGVGTTILKSNKLLTFNFSGGGSFSTDQKKTNCPMITNAGFRQTLTAEIESNFEIRGITFQGNKAADENDLGDALALEYCAGLAMSGVENVTVADCAFHDWNGDGFGVEHTHIIDTGTFEAVDTSDDSVTVTGHGLPTGEQLYVKGSDLPAGLAQSTSYKAFSKDKDTLKFGVYATGATLPNDVSSISGDTITFYAAHTLNDGDLVFMWTPRPSAGHSLPGSVGTQQDCTVDAANDEIDDVGHGLTENTVILFDDVNLDSALEVNKPYFVLSSPGADSFQIGATVGGSAVDLQGDGGGTMKYRVLSGVHDRVEYYVVNATSTTLQLSLTSGGSAVTLPNEGEGIMRIAKFVDLTDAGSGTQTYKTMHPNRNIRFERNIGSGCLRGVATYITAKDSYMINNYCYGDGVGLHLENGGATGAENAKPLQNITVASNRCTNMAGRPMWVATGGDDQFFATKLLDNIFENCTLTGFGNPLFIMAGNDSVIEGNTFRNITVDNYFFRMGGRGLRFANNIFSECSSAAYFLEVLGAINSTPCYTNISDNKFINCTSTGTQGTGATRLIYGQSLGRYSAPEGLIIERNILSQVTGFYYGIFADHPGVIIRDNLLDPKSDMIRGIYNQAGSTNASIYDNKFNNISDPIYNDDSMTTLIRDNLGAELTRATDVDTALSALVRVIQDPDGTPATRNLPFDVLFNAVHEDSIRQGLITSGTWFMGYKGQGAFTASVAEDFAWSFGRFTPVKNGTLSNVKVFTASGSSFNVTAGVWTDSNGTFTADDSTDVITSVGHGLVDDDTVTLSSTGTLPGGLAVTGRYYVISATTDTFQLSATSGGSAIDITDTGSGTHTWYGGAGALVAESAQVATQISDWTTFPLGGEAITAGTYYWLGFVHDAAPLSVKYNTNATTDVKYVASTYSAGALPDPYPSGGATLTKRQYSIYAEYDF